MSGERLVCVDDDSQVRAVVECFVVAAGYDCVGVGTVDEARNAILEGSGHAFDPDVVNAFVLSLEAVAA